MSTTKHSSERRTDALTQARIVDAAIHLLDAHGERGLTFRALALHLGTGHGAIQWHVANKAELMRSATSVVVKRALDGFDPAEAPRYAIHAAALGVFDAIKSHPWVGAELSRPPWQGTMMQLFELLGRQIRALGAPTATQFTATTALLHYIIGVSSQAAINIQSPAIDEDRQEVLDELAEQWRNLDAAAYDFTRSMADPLRSHDDRAEYLAGIDLMLAGASGAV
jgi:AcrR family transcriptional regulator